MAINWQFYHWHLEPSAICTLRCPRCPRTEHPETPWLNYSMDLKFVQSFLTPELLTSKVQRITMCGDVGDPIYCKEYIEICRYIKTVNPKIHLVTITNGSYKKPMWWEELASVLNERDVIHFSIDGYDNTSNNLYRVNSDFDSIIEGIRTVRKHNSKVFLTWAAIVFRFNQDHIDQIKTLATGLGMDTLQLTKSTKFGSKYGAAYSGSTDPLEPRAEWISSTDRYERTSISLSNRTIDIAEYIAFNMTNYVNARVKYQHYPITPLCEIGNRGVYVNAEGVIFPCSWTSFPYTQLAHGNKVINWQDSFFAKHRDQMNLRNQSLDKILADPLWYQCSNGWTDSTKTWVECSQKCSTHLVDENYAISWETN